MYNTIMSKLVQNINFKQRVLYTFCFFALCLIDWAKGSLNGRVQMMATNMTGILLAVVILSAFKLNQFFKPVYMIWIALCIAIIPVGVKVTLSVYPYKGQVITAAINIAVYGIILIRVLMNQIIRKAFSTLRILAVTVWLVMLILMLFSVNENIWPAWYAGMFGTFYIVDFDKDTEKNILLSIPDGIILGFFVIQGIALLFRPYDFIRYLGLYVNPNFNALFYLMSYSAFLCKWFALKKTGKYPILKVIICLFAASMYGFCIYTGSKSAILAMILVTCPFSICILKYCKNKMLSFISCWMILGFVGIISIPIVYCAIRYVPTVHLHPLYFEGEYSMDRVLPGEPRDSEKYISFEFAMEYNMGRVLYQFPEFVEYLDSLLTMKVHAAESEEFQETEFLFSEEEVAAGIDPFELRQRIFKYYLEQLNLVGHTNDYKGAPISVYSSEPHSHNVFIQMAFLYGVPSGILFILMVLAYVPACISLMKTGEDYRVCLISCFVLAFVIFGFFEIDWMCGQLPFTMFFLLFRDVVRKRELHR